MRPRNMTKRKSVQFNESYAHRTESAHEEGLWRSKRYINEKGTISSGAMVEERDDIIDSASEKRRGYGNPRPKY